MKMANMYVVVCVFLTACLCRCGPVPGAEEDEGSGELIQAIAEFVKDSDRDIRALAMQQIREEVPGAAATRQFATLLPEITPEAQAELLEALGDIDFEYPFGSHPVMLQAF